jgi:hypothetical protein
LAYATTAMTSLFVAKKMVHSLLFLLELGDTDDLNDQEETNLVDMEPQNTAARDDWCLY